MKSNAKINLLIFLFLTLTSIALSFLFPVFFLNENQILYFFSASSQVIAAIYGLIITGYIFLRNELDRKAENDESLEEVISILKTDYFNSIKNISIVTVLSITSCLLVIANENSQIPYTTDILINLSGSLIITELIIIASFVIRILHPNNIENVSDKLRNEISISNVGENGSIEQFLKNYNQVQYIITKYGNVNELDVNDYESAKAKRFSNAKLVRIMRQDGRINNELMQKLMKLISFRNSFIHGRDLTLSQEDVNNSTKVLTELQQQLNVR
jgi:hypothetical protein